MTGSVCQKRDARRSAIDGLDRRQHAPMGVGRGVLAVIDSIFPSRAELVVLPGGLIEPLIM